MSKKLSVNTKKIIGIWWWNLLGESIQAARKAECELAIHQSSFHQLSQISWVMDGPKEHKHTYKVLSRVGVLMVSVMCGRINVQEI